MVQIRANDDRLVFQQLPWDAEVRSLKDLDIEHDPVSDTELKLALQIIARGESDTYDPDQFENVEQKRVLAVIDAKIEGQQIAPAEESAPLPLSSPYRPISPIILASGPLCPGPECSYRSTALRSTWDYF